LAKMLCWREVSVAVVFVYERAWKRAALEEL
jgi:hypothetical protein